MYRPYPNADRALRQIQRHDEECGPFAPATPPSPLTLKLAKQANAMMATQTPVAEKFLAGMSRIRIDFVPVVDALASLRFANVRRPA